MIAPRSGGLGRLTRPIALAGLIGLVGMALVTIIDVLLRWLANSPIDGVEEVSRLVVAIAIASFFPMALAERHHIAIAFLGNLLGPRARLWLEALAASVTSLFFLVLAWQFVLYTAELRSGGETTWLLGWPVAPWWAVATLFMVICVPVQAVVLAQVFRSAAQGEEAAPTTAEPVGPSDAEY